MGEAYKRVQKYFNREGITRVPSDRSPLIGSVKPVNCSHPCPYGNNHAYCWPCYKKIMDEHKAKKRKVSEVVSLAM